MMKLQYFLVPFFFCVLAAACAPEKAPEEKKVAEPPPPVEQKITANTTFANNINGFDATPGPAGVFDVPEMLVLSLQDSAAQGAVSTKMVVDFKVLEEDMSAVGAEMNGPIGMIAHNNDVKNFKFETLLCISKVPVNAPKHSKVTVLEASQMLIYNYYGSYQNLFGAYSQIKKYCETHDLIQSGPMREFYITDPEKEKDPAKWLTRIFLPVISMHKTK